MNPTTLITSRWASFNNNPHFGVASTFDAGNTDLSYNSYISYIYRNRCAQGFHGWAGDYNVGTFTLTFKGNGYATIDYGNCWDKGRVKLYVNSRWRDEASTSSSNWNKVYSFAFAKGDTMQLKDEGENSVVLVRSIKITMAKDCNIYQTMSPPNGRGYVAGGWGGPCTCPDGTTFTVGEVLGMGKNNEGGSCQLLACYGGVPGECKPGVSLDDEFNSKGVFCAPPPPPTSFIAATATTKKPASLDSSTSLTASSTATTANEDGTSSILQTANTSTNATATPGATTTWLQVTNRCNPLADMCDRANNLVCSLEVYECRYKTDEDSKNNFGPPVGGALGGLMFLVLLVFGAYRCRNRDPSAAGKRSRQAAARCVTKRAPQARHRGSRENATQNPAFDAGSDDVLGEDAYEGLESVHVTDDFAAVGSTLGTIAPNRAEYATVDENGGGRGAAAAVAPVAFYVESDPNQPQVYDTAKTKTPGKSSGPTGTGSNVIAATALYLEPSVRQQELYDGAKKKKTLEKKTMRPRGKSKSSGDQLYVNQVPQVASGARSKATLSARGPTKTVQVHANQGEAPAQYDVLEPSYAGLKGTQQQYDSQPPIIVARAAAPQYTAFSDAFDGAQSDDDLEV